MTAPANIDDDASGTNLGACWTTRSGAFEALEPGGNAAGHECSAGRVASRRLRDNKLSDSLLDVQGGELPVFTIGHSNRPLEVFVEILNSVGIKALVDIRTVPKSRANPWFWGDNLRVELPLAGVQYHRFDYLGGLRGKSKTVPPEVNAFWQNQSFHNYADWTQGPEFLIGFSELLTLSREVSTVIMCAEVLWWRCHRRIVADYLISAGRTVFHVFDANHVDPASMTTSAIVVGDHIQYPKGA